MGEEKVEGREGKEARSGNVKEVKIGRRDEEKRTQCKNKKGIKKSTSKGVRTGRK